MPDFRCMSPKMLSSLPKLLSYNHYTGELYWLKSGKGRRLAPAQAGCLGSDGRRTIGLDRSHWPAARLIYALVTGEDPGSDRVVDHINGDPSDNRWVNLRLATWAENCINRVTRSNTGHKGIYRTRRGNFIVQICRTVGRGPVGVRGSTDGIRRKTHHIGTFDSIEDAKVAYICAVYDFGAEDFSRPANLRPIKRGA